MAEKGKYGSAMRYASLATQWMAMLVLAAWIGWKLDKWLQWKYPLFVLILPLTALIVSMIKLMKELGGNNKKSEK